MLNFCLISTFVTFPYKTLGNDPIRVPGRLVNHRQETQFINKWLLDLVNYDQLLASRKRPGQRSEGPTCIYPDPANRSLTPASGWMAESGWKCRIPEDDKGASRGVEGRRISLVPLLVPSLHTHEGKHRRQGRDPTGNHNNHRGLPQCSNEALLAHRLNGFSARSSKHKQTQKERERGVPCFLGPSSKSQSLCPPMPTTDNYFVREHVYSWKSI